ncbi:MAG: ABC transporter substrate-binding protein [Novosphingobium sp.]
MRFFINPLRFLFLGLALSLAGCNSSQSSNDDSGVVLHVGDQLKGLKSLIDSAGEGEPRDYTIKWANFVGGPPIIAAQTGGSIDVGWMAETPLIFAQAAGSPVRVVAVSTSAKPDGSAYALVVKPNSPIRSIADLKGKSVAYMRGTVLHYMVARLLEDAGLSLHDVRSVQVTGFGSSLLDQDVADALTLTEPYLTQLLEAGKIRVLATGAPPATPGFNYLVASDAALADPVKAKAIGDLVARAARATRWQRENVAQAAPDLATVYRIEPRIAEKMIERSPSRYAPIGPSIIAAHQSEADLFHKLGLIRTRLDASKIFDPRYDALIAQVENDQ